MNLVKGLIKYSELVFKSYLQDIFKDYLKLDKSYFELRTKSNTTVRVYDLYCLCVSVCTL